MRLALSLAAVACAFVASGCGDACKDLGERLCNCTPAGQTRATCERNIQNEISRLNPDGDALEVCEAKLDTCHAPDAIDFCDWLDGRCGKSACGMSEESWEELSAPGGLCAVAAE
jgi:hypothetical protein